MTTHALSVKQPWAWAILHAGKDVENRSWAPPAQMIGQRFAIHASKKDDDELAWVSIHLVTGKDAPPDDLPRGVIVGSVRLVGIGRPGVKVSPWHVADQWAWRIADPVLLANPIPTRGALGLWLMPVATAEVVRASTRATEVRS